MYETPRTVPYEIVNDDGQGATETRDLDIGQYGDVYDPHGATRTRPGIPLDPDHDGDPA